MANLIDITSNILSQNTICFETKNINSEHIPIPIPDAKFGILNFRAVTAEETNDELDFLFIVDCSGSMIDLCSDGRTKMQHIIHTLKNMILFFHEHPTAKVNITIYAFDSQIYSIVSRTKITNENLHKIIFMIEKITPKGCTNIELALRKSAEEINKLRREFPTNIVNHIFMTDGKATDGLTNIELLSNIVNPDVINAFIGFGVEHDAALLNGISSVAKSAYYFIDKLESAGLVYGEILHGIIYKLLTEAEIIIENGLIYNYKNNTWNDSLKIGDIVSEANKTYNIISCQPDKCRVNIKANMGDLTILFPSTHIQSDDLSIQIYRQRTLQILYEVNDFCNRAGNLYEEIYDEKEKKNLKLKMITFIEEIKKYMIDNTLENDKTLKNLCDDVYICLRTFGTTFGSMYCTARQTSQGAQRQYTVSSLEATDDIYENSNIRMHGIPVLHRQTNDVEFEDLDLPFLDYTISDFTDTPYLSNQATQVMNEISGIFNYNDLFNEEVEDDEILTQCLN
jgi:uncharacterized protein YegL